MKKLVFFIPFLMAGCMYKTPINTDREAAIIASNIASNNELVVFFDAHKDVIDTEYYNKLVEYQNLVADDLNLAKEWLIEYNDSEAPSPSLLESIKRLLAETENKLAELAAEKIAFLKWLEEKKKEKHENDTIRFDDDIRGRSNGDWSYGRIIQTVRRQTESQFTVAP